MAVLPFADMSLFTTSSAVGIMCSAFLAITLLGEHFICKYDLSASLLISIGAFLTIMQMNKEVLQVYDHERVFELWTSR